MKKATYEKAQQLQTKINYCTTRLHQVKMAWEVSLGYSDEGMHESEVVYKLPDYFVQAHHPNYEGNPIHPSAQSALQLEPVEAQLAAQYIKSLIGYYEGEIDCLQAEFNDLSDDTIHLYDPVTPEESHAD